MWIRIRWNVDPDPESASASMRIQMQGVKNPPCVIIGTGMYYDFRHFRPELEARFAEYHKQAAKAVAQ